MAQIRLAAACAQPLPRDGARTRRTLGRDSVVLGPWAWLVVVYAYDTSADVVVVLTMQDARRAESPTS